MSHVSSNPIDTEAKKRSDDLIIDAFAELSRVDAALARVLAEGGGEDLEDLPEAVALNTRRDEILTTLCEVQARTIAGVEAKAQALRTPDLIADYERHGALAVSLADDIARLAEERASLEQMPIVQTISTEGRRLFRLASGELDARMAELQAQGIAGAELDEHKRRLRRELRVDALFELTDDDIGAPGRADATAAAPSEDAALLALAPELQAAGSAYRAYNRDNEVLPSDPDYAEAHETADTLYRAVVDVAQRIFALEPQTLSGLCVVAQAVTLIAEERWDEAPEHIEGDGRLLRRLGNGLFRLAGVDWRGQRLPNGTAPAPVDVHPITPPDPTFAAAAAHRSAHIDWLATLKQPDDALRNAAMDRKAAAFETLLTTRPRTEAGRLVYVTQALFEFCHAADGPPAESWVREAGRQINGGFPITEESVPRLAIEPTAAGSALDAAIEAYDAAYAHRLYSAIAGEADVVERAEQEREAFRTLLHMPLGSDAARVAYAKAVLGRAVGYHGDECLGEGRTAPLAVAYRNLAHGQFWPEDEAPLPMAAE